MSKMPAPNRTPIAIRGILPLDRLMSSSLESKIAPANPMPKDIPIVPASTRLTTDPGNRYHRLFVSYSGDEAFDSALATCQGDVSDVDAESAPDDANIARTASLRPTCRDIPYNR